jgi:DME family drug/metabolite transporter
MENKSTSAAGMALAAAVLWGTTGTAQSFAPAHTSAYWIGALRLVIASVFFAAFVVWQQRGRPSDLRLPSGAKPWALLAGLCVAAYNLSFFAGIKATGVAVGTVMAIGSGPVWAGVLQSLVSGKPPTPVWWMGTVLAVAGAGLMVTGADAGAGLRIDPVGLALCLLAGLAYATYTLISQRLVSRTPPATVTLWIFASAALMAVPAASLMSAPVMSLPGIWAVVMYLGLVSTGLAYLLFSHALQHISGATGVTLALAEPVAAFGLAIVVVGERPGPWAFVGLGLVLAGLLLVVWTETVRAVRSSRPVPDHAPSEPSVIRRS